ncbi:MAG: hypothetical protein K2I18_03240 [Paramuribaculum sp.]|nr:hypothetical protein [Paramuribaculum sp.]
METKEENKATGKEAMEYPGVAINKADNDKNNECLQKQSTKELNNNPRNDEM